ncbi:uncharacterized protein [Drosophila takahashii]|uniref:uncharacterized protein isoform X2 n=1 Tax=Drosophila takahashii TaxID=29030 RepID=UPI0038992816
MCNCPPILFKIAVLLSIVTTIVSWISWCSLNKYAIQTVNLVVCFIVLVALAMGIYGAIMSHIFIIKTLMIILVLFSLFKIVTWIVCANLSTTLSTVVIHIWFQVNTASSIICTVLTVNLWMRLHEQTREFQLGY